MRFLAIITVVIFHLNSAYSRGTGIGLQQSIQMLGGQETPLAWGWWLVRLDLGVKVFFAISGFVLALPFLQHYLNGKHKVNIRAYFIRRLTRLEPPFVLSLLIFFAVHLIILHANGADFTRHLLAGLVYAHVFIYGEPNPINPVTWSLETEAQFYTLVPLLFALIFLTRRYFFPIISLLVLMMASVLFKHHFYASPQVSSSIAAYFMNFGVGILFAMLYLTLPYKRWSNKKMGYDLLGLTALMGLFYFYKPQHHYESMAGFNISLFLLFAGIFKGRWLNYFFTRPWVFTIGGMCYSIYLLHYAFFHLWVKLTARISLGLGYGTDLLLQLIIAIPVVLVLSVVYFILIERPCMDKDWLNNFTEKILRNRKP